MSDPTMPRASLVVCTRNRADQISATLRSLLAPDRDDIEVIVVDQSDDDRTERTVAEFDDPRLVYVRTDTKGTGRSRRIGYATARAEFVLYTDDDCLAPPDWAEGMLRPFDDPGVGVVFCAVRPLVTEHEAGFTPNFEFGEDEVVTSLWRYYYRHGMGAGMAVRRAAGDAVGGFDPQLGPGSRFTSGEDADIAIRALIEGWKVANTARTSIVHDGLRPWPDYPALARRDWYSLGATYVKPLRRGVPAMYWVTAFQLVYRCVVEPLLTVRPGRRPTGFKRLWYLVSGLRDGARHPMHPGEVRFLDDGEAVAPAVEASTST